MENPAEKVMDERLKTLFDYTKFHIGMYTTLIAAIIGVFATDNLKNQHFVSMIPYLKGSVVLFLLAGMFGGLIASSIPLFTNLDEFLNARLAPWTTRKNVGVRAIWCTHVEHTCFWMGCVFAVIGLFVSLE